MSLGDSMTIKDIFSMLDLFYANKHLYVKVRRTKEALAEWKKHQKAISKGIK